MEEWIKLVEAVCSLAGDWMGYENSSDPEVVKKHDEIFRSTAIALREKARMLLKNEII